MNACLVSGEKLFFVVARIEIGRVQMQKSAVMVCGAPPLVYATVTLRSDVVISVTGQL